MTCHVCKAQIASGSRFCSVCGSSTEPVAVAKEGANSRVDQLLAEANLCKLRSQWTEAERLCVATFGAGCLAPVAAFHDGKTLHALIAEENGAWVERRSGDDPVAIATELLAFK